MSEAKRCSIALFARSIAKQTTIAPLLANRSMSSLSFEKVFGLKFPSFQQALWAYKNLQTKEHIITFYRLIKMIFLHFFLSKNRKLYWDLSVKYKTTPWFVYSLAHGRPTRGPKGKKILKELLNKGIIDEISLS